MVIKKKYWLVFVIVFLVISTFILNKTVTTSIGVNYKVSRIELPLYLKLINFYDRHLNLQWLANRITKNEKTKKDKVLKLLEWTYTTIVRQPKSLPVMDGHVLNVYIRRYGVSDNFHDLFSTLNNYIGVDSYFSTIYINNNTDRMNFTYIHSKLGWVIFDPYNGVYFKSLTGDKWATISEIKAGKWQLEKLPESNITKADYEPFISSLPDIKKITLKRASLQSPWNRFSYQVKHWFSDEMPLLE